jgi:hypothetical protein
MHRYKEIAQFAGAFGRAQSALRDFDSAEAVNYAHETMTSERVAI